MPPMFAHFELPNVPDVSRRTASMALVVGVAALVACVSFGNALLGLGACIGLGLGTVQLPDDRQLGGPGERQRGREQAAAAGPQHPRSPGHHHRGGHRPHAGVPQLGLGVFGGLFVFQIILLANVARSMAKAGPMTSVDDVITANVIEDNIGHGAAPPAGASASGPTTTHRAVPDPMPRHPPRLSAPLLGIDISPGVHPQVKLGGLTFDVDIIWATIVAGLRRDHHGPDPGPQGHQRRARASSSWCGRWPSAPSRSR